MLPDPEDAAAMNAVDSSKDCFARDKFADYRDDMGGVGSFNRQNRTLYVGRIKETGTGDETEEVVRRHFKEWGPIERSAYFSLFNIEPGADCCLVRVLQYRSVAFVTYEHELHAQFAKEAMACQSLDNDEILNVRWATEDPNPTQKIAEKRRLEEIGQEAIKARMDPRVVDAMRAVRALEEGVELEDGYLMEEDEQEPDSKRRRLLEGQDDNASPPPPPQQQQQQIEAPPQPTGLLNADTLESLKYFAEIRKRNGAPVAAKVGRPTPAVTKPGLGLADYGSDEDDD